MLNKIKLPLVLVKNLLKFIFIKFLYKILRSLFNY